MAMDRGTTEEGAIFDQEGLRRLEPIAESAGDFRERFIEAVRSRPLLAVLAASGVGATLGGLVFSRLGRFVFLAAAGYVAGELWRREGVIDTREILTRLTRTGATDEEPG
jgi:hypothetical protein